jgi:hypothetical protein
MPHPILSGFLQGFGDTIAANRKQSQEEADKAFQRDHDTLATLVEHSNDPEIQNRAMSGLVSMNQGKYQAGGLARFLGGKGLTGTSPDVQSLLDFVRSRGASPSGAGAATGGAPPPVPGSAAQPAETVTERGGTAAPLPSPSPASVATGGGMGPKDMGGPLPAPQAPSGAPSGGAAMAGAPPPALPSAVAPPGSSTAPAGGGGASPSSSRGTTIPETMAPTASNAKAVTQVKPTASAPAGAPAGAPPPAMPAASMAGQPPPFNPQSGFGLMTPMQQDVWAAGAESRKRGQDYQAGYDNAKASLQVSHPDISPEDLENASHLEGLRWAGLPAAMQKPEKVLAVDPDTGQYYTSLRSFNQVTGSWDEVAKLDAPNPMATKTPTDRGLLAKQMFGHLFGPNMTGLQIEQALSPEQLGQLNQEFMRQQAAMTGSKAAAAAAQAPYQETTPEGGMTQHLPGPPPAFVPKVGGGSAPPSAAAGASAAAPVAPVAAASQPVAGSGGGVTAAPLAGAPTVGTQVGQAPGQPEKPVAVPEGITSPDQPQPQTAGVAGAQPPPATAPPSGRPGERVVQTKPDVAVDVKEYARMGGTGAEYLDPTGLSGEQKTLAVRDATAKGIRVLSPTQAQGLQDFQKARENVLNYTKQLLPYLAKSPANRLKTSFNNWVSETLQTTPELAAMVSEWTTAIDTVRGPQMRITFPEIKQSLTGLPEQSDTIATVLQKMRNLTGTFDRAENAILPPPREVVDAQRTGALKPGYGWTIATGPHTGEEWAYLDDLTYHRIK